MSLGSPCASRGKEMSVLGVRPEACDSATCSHVSLFSGDVHGTEAVGSRAAPVETRPPLYPVLGGQPGNTALPGAAGEMQEINGTNPTKGLTAPLRA